MRRGHVRANRAQAAIWPPGRRSVPVSCSLPTRVPPPVPGAVVTQGRIDDTDAQLRVRRATARGGRSCHRGSSERRCGARAWRAARHLRGRSRLRRHRRGRRRRRAVEQTRALRPDIVVMDIRSPARRNRGNAANPDRATRRPSCARLYDVRPGRYVYQALRAGASGFMLKDAPPSQLREAVRTVRKWRDAARPGGHAAAGRALRPAAVPRPCQEKASRTHPALDSSSWTGSEADALISVLSWPSSFLNTCSTCSTCPRIACSRARVRPPTALGTGLAGQGHPERGRAPPSRCSR